MRLIDADELKDWSEIVPLTGDGGIDINDFDEKLKSMPTVDAVPVIRCKDCEYYEIAYLKKDGSDDRRYKPTWCSLWRVYMGENDFCSMGERKEEE